MKAVNPPPSMSWDCERKPEHPEEPVTVTGRTCGLCTDSTGVQIQPGSLAQRGSGFTTPRHGSSDAHVHRTHKTHATRHMLHGTRGTGQLTCRTLPFVVKSNLPESFGKRIVVDLQFGNLECVARCQCSTVPSPRSPPPSPPTTPSTPTHLRPLPHRPHHTFTFTTPLKPLRPSSPRQPSGQSRQSYPSKHFPVTIAPHIHIDSPQVLQTSGAIYRPARL